MKISPSKAYSNGFTYKTSNKKVATVSSKGVIKAVAAGKAKITIVSKANKKIKTTVTVTVKAAPSQPSTQQPSTQQPSTQQPGTQQPGTPDQPSKVEVTGVSLNKTEATLYANKTLDLTATVEPANATDKTVTWKTDKENIVTLDVDAKDSSKVVVKPVSEGTVTVTATAGGKTASCVVTVVTQENALSCNKYTLLKDAEKYTITRGTSTFAFTQEEIEADLAKIAEETNKTWTNETVFDYIAKATTETLSGKLGLFQRILKEVPDASVEATAGKVTDNSIDVQDSLDCAGWWTAHTDGVEIADGSAVKFTFDTKTYATAEKNWNTPIYVVYTGDEPKVGGAGYGEYFVSRSDMFGWGGAALGAFDTNAPEKFPEGFAWERVSEPNWDTFLNDNKAGTNSTLSATLENGLLVVTFTNDGAVSKATIPVDATKPVYISLSGELCTLNNIKAEYDVQEKYLSEKNVTVTKDGKVKKCTVSGKLGEDGISLDITAEDGRTVNITELNVEEKDDTHVLTFNVNKSGSVYQFKLVIAKNAKNVTLYRVVNSKDEVVASFVDGDDSYDLEFNETYYNEFVEKYDVEDVVKTVTVMNDYQPVK